MYKRRDGGEKEQNSVGARGRAKGKGKEERTRKGRTQKRKKATERGGE